jgi:hypothetical protein
LERPKDLLPLELTFSVPSHQITLGVNERKLAKASDVHVRMEAGDKPRTYTLHLSSYERNAGESELPDSCYTFHLMTRHDAKWQFGFVSENIYEYFRRIVRLPSRGSVAPAALLMTWRGIQNSGGGRSLPAVDHVPVGAESREAAIIVRPKISSEPRLAIPASLYALRFDDQSFRQLARLLDQSGLSNYAGIINFAHFSMALYRFLGKIIFKK